MTPLGSRFAPLAVRMWLIALGVLILVAGTVDLLWTTLGTHGGGPLSSPLTKLIWKTVLGLHRRRRHHKLLSFAGSAILFWLLGFWVCLVWVAWVLIFSGGNAPVLDVKTGAPIDLGNRIYFVGSAMFTAGTSEFAANGHAWHIASALTAASGLFVITMAITYILAVLGAAVEKRVLGSFIWDMGGTAERIIERAWDGEKFVDFFTHLVELDTMIETFAEQHLAYPILQYYTAENRRTAAPLRLAALYDMLLLLSEGTAQTVRPPALLLYGCRDAVRGFSEVIAHEFVRPAEDPPPRPDLSILTSRGIPAVSLEEFGAAVDREADVRKRLFGMVLESGWEWNDVFSTDLKP